MTSVLVAPSRTADLPVRICEAFLTCLERQGLRGTSVDDVAMEAGCGRASIYRVIPGGRAGLLHAAVEHQLRALREVVVAASVDAPTLPEAVARAVHAAATTLRSSAPLQRLLAEEPGAILPLLSFEGLQPILDRVAEWSPSLFGRFGTDAQARAAGDWIARVVLAHLRTPGAPIDLTDPEDCRRLVDTFFPSPDPTH